MNISETSAVHMKRLLKSSLKAKDMEGKKVNLNKYLKVKLKNCLEFFNINSFRTLKLFPLTGRRRR